jgi:hypothetical protein
MGRVSAFSGFVVRACVGGGGRVFCTGRMTRQLVEIGMKRLIFVTATLFLFACTGSSGVVESDVVEDVGGADK